MTVETQGLEATTTTATTESPQTTEAAGKEASPPAAVPKGLERIEGATAAPKAGPAQTAQPKYQPNFKFKVLDKEHEFDEFLRGAVKDQDTEKKLRDIYERAYGLDSVKADRQTLKTELATVKEKVAKTDEALNSLGEFIQKDDFDSFFDAWKIPKDKVLRYALELVQREQWSPEQKAQWEAGRSAQQQALYYQQQNQQLMQSQQQFAVQQRTFELEQAVSRAEIAPIVQAYEAGIGSPGAFRDYVIRIGQAYAAQGKDIAAADAVAEAVRHLRAVNPSLGQTVATTAPATTVVPAAAKPVIPNIQGRGTSAVKSSVRSIDDLKKRARDLEAMG